MPTFSMRAEVNDLSPMQQAVAQVRLACLQEHLDQLPYSEGQIRDDSRLAWLFCTSPHLDAEDIAHEISCANYLHSHTKYPDVIERRLQQASKILKAAFPGASWAAVWHQLRTYGVPVSKLAIAATEPSSCELPSESTLVWADATGRNEDQ